MWCVGAAVESQVDEARGEIHARLAHALHGAAAGIDATGLQPESGLEGTIDVDTVDREGNHTESRDKVGLGGGIYGRVGDRLRDARGRSRSTRVATEARTRVAGDGTRELARGGIEREAALDIVAHNAAVA